MAVVYGVYTDKHAYMMVDISPGGGTDEDFIKPARYKALRYKALIDTGATHSCISPKVVNDLGLPTDSSALMHDLRGFTMRATYSVRIGTPLGTAPEHSIISKEGKVIKVTASKIESNETLSFAF